MVQKGKKRPSGGEKPHRKGGKSRKAGSGDKVGSGSVDWVPGGEIVSGESDLILDVDSDNPFLDLKEDRTGMSEAGSPPPAKVRQRPPDEALGKGPEAPGRGGLLPGSGFLDALFIDFPFPAGKEAVACHLAQDAYIHGGPAESFHDIVIQLDSTLFKNIHDLKSALGDRFAWETSYGSHRRREGGVHG